MNKSRLARQFLMVSAAALLLSACATRGPLGPHVTVMPAPGKPFDQFRAEDRECRQYAQESIGNEPGKASDEAMAKSAVVGGLIGAAVGSAMGGRHDNTAFGAGVGVLAGATAGASEGRITANDLQRRYDVAYSQCMYAKGNQLPQASYQAPSKPGKPKSTSGQLYYPPPPPSR